MLGACQFSESGSWHDSCNRRNMSKKFERKIELPQCEIGRDKAIGRRFKTPESVLSLNAEGW